MKKIRGIKSGLIILLMSLSIMIVFVSCKPAEVKEFSLSDSEMKIMKTDEGVEYVRTPDKYFENLPDWPYEYKYVEIDGLRQGYAEAGPSDGEVVLLLHGQPSWSYLYRKMIPVLADAGYRVIAMDHLGMGRSDKPTDLEYFSYDNHVYRLEKFIENLELKNITAFVQDWGSLIGLNVIGNHPDWFARVVVGDGALPIIPEGVIPYPLPEDVDEAIEAFESNISKIPDQQPEFYNDEGELKALMSSSNAGYFGNWILYSRYNEDFRASTILEAITYFPLTEEEREAYNAPFPARIAMAAPRTFPGLANELGGKTQSAWEGLSAYEKPFLTIWASNDPGQLGRKEVQQVLIDQIPGAEGQPHTRLAEASHFLQDDQGELIAELMIEFMKANPIK